MSNKDIPFQTTNSKKIVIIGGGGFIGSWVTKHFLELGHKVVVIDPFYNYTSVDPELFKKIINFRKEQLLKGSVLHSLDYMYGGTQILEEFQPEIVIDLAAISLEGTNDPLISKKQLVDQTILVEQIISDVKKFNISRFLFISSIFAYGDIDNWTATEKNPLNPKTPYGISKAIGEFITKAYLENWNIVRTTSVYGFGDANMRVVQNFINKALKGQEFWVNKDALLDFTYVKDLAKGIATIILSNQVNQAFQITGGKAVLLPDLVEEIKRYYKDLKYEVRGEPNDRPQRGTMDITKARILLNWQPEYSLETGIKDYIKYVTKYNFA